MILIHCITIISPVPLSHNSSASSVEPSGGGLLAPPSYDSTASLTASPRNLAVPALQLETPCRWYRPQPPRPALRFDAPSNKQGRLCVRARRATFSPLSPVTTIQEDNSGRRSYASGSSIPNTPIENAEDVKKDHLELGIPEVPFKPDPSPIQSPGSERLDTAEKGESIKKNSIPNFTEGIKQNIWKYSASRNVVKRWLLGIISWLLSALCTCMCVIIILLFFLQNKRFPKRCPMNITLNAYIATLSKVASASLMLPISKSLSQLKWN